MISKLSDQQLWLDLIHNSTNTLLQDQLSHTTYVTLYHRCFGMFFVPSCTNLSQDASATTSWWKINRSNNWIIISLIYYLQINNNIKVKSQQDVILASKIILSIINTKYVQSAAFCVTCAQHSSIPKGIDLKYQPAGENNINVSFQ